MVKPQSQGRFANSRNAEVISSLSTAATSLAKRCKYISLKAMTLYLSSLVMGRNGTFDGLEDAEAGDDQPEIAEHRKLEE